MRLHREDLRDIVAAIRWGQPGYEALEDAFLDADEVLAYGARTAQSEAPAPKPCTHERNDWDPSGNDFICSDCGLWSYDDGETWEPKRPAPARSEDGPLDFHIENRAGVDVVVFHSGGCHPATDTESSLWAEVARLKEENERFKQGFDECSRSGLLLGQEVARLKAQLADAARHREALEKAKRWLRHADGCIGDVEQCKCGLQQFHAALAPKEEE